MTDVPNLDSAMTSPTELAPPTPELAARAAALHADALVWDDHSGFEPSPLADLDLLERWRSAGVDYLSVNVGYDVISWQATIRTLADFRARIGRRPDRYLLVERVADVLEARKRGLLGITFDLEGMDALNEDVSMVALYHRLGVRQMLFAYNLNNAAGGGCHDRDIGLTDFGRAVVDEMNRVGMVVDCSHSAHATTMEAMERSIAPVIFSHSNPAALTQHGRNIRDDQIRACATTGGVIGLNGIGLFLGDQEARTESIFRRIDYVVQLVGIEHAGIGLDYPFPVAGVDIDGLLRTKPGVWPASAGYGTGLYRNAEPEQLPGLTEVMVRAGYSDEAIRAVLGENFLRVARAVWK
jgi:membrane dipeptidase